MFMVTGDLEVFSTFRSDMRSRQEKLLRAHSDNAGFILHSKSRSEPNEDSHLTSKVSTNIKVENMDEEIFLNSRDPDQGIFVDCTAFDPAETGKIEVEGDDESDDYQEETDEDNSSEDSSFEPQTSTFRKRRSNPRIKPTNEEHLTLLKELKQLLKKNKSKQISCPRCFKVS